MRSQDKAAEQAEEIAEELGQDVFPSGSARDPLRESAPIRLTWVLVFLYAVSFGGGVTSMSAWFPTYWNLFHGLDLATAGLLAGVFIVYGPLIRIPGGSLSDRFGGENVATASFLTMGVGAAVMTVATGFWPAVLGVIVLATGMGVANGAVFELVPKFVPEAVGGASGWVSGIDGAGTLVILPTMGLFVDLHGKIGYARGFSLFVVLSGVCAATSLALKLLVSGDEDVDDGAVH